MDVETVSYVLPLRCEASHDSHEELAAYLRDLEGVCEIVLVDGSGSDVFAEHARAFPAGVRHIRPDPDLRFANGKVNGVTTGIRHAAHERVVLADDDVRYGHSQLRAVSRRLATADLVVPQNYFRPLPWHARWDAGRSLLNRALAFDFPGTLAVRRSTFLSMGGYDGDVLFENLELIRTVRVHGGSIDIARDVLVRRRPPSARQFWSQRSRQAYDDLAQPARLAVELAVLPMATWTLVRHRRWLAGWTLAIVALAELGRRRQGARAVIPPDAALFAPVWLLERGVCV